MDEAEYEELTDLAPLFVEANHYLGLHEVGLAPDRSELPNRVIEAIVFVHGERARQMRDQSSGKFQNETLTDSELMAVHQKMKGKRRR